MPFIHPPASSHPAPSGARQAPTIWRKHVIMVIDDSLFVRRVVEACFSRVGMETASFPDGLSAISALAAGKTSVPDLLLLDIGLPKMDGYEVAKVLRSNADFQDTILVMLTGRDGVWDRVHSKLVGARDYIKKPFRIAELVERVQELLGIVPLSPEERPEMAPR
ncbi:MAG: response regulator [Ktedonobacterales bacterium]|nr:response regulator [Ktedonobacterales bacterium]